MGVADDKGLVGQWNAAIGPVFVPGPPADPDPTSWAGSVVVMSDGYTVDSVSGQWTVPHVVATPVNDTDSYPDCACWIGIDGWDNHGASMFRVGTTQSRLAGQPVTAWYQFAPADPMVIHNFPVSAGDVVQATVQVNDPNQVLFQLVNRTARIATSVGVDGIASSETPLKLSSAEWIVSPAEPGQSATEVPQYGVVYFDDCSATMAYERASIFPVDLGTWQILSTVDHRGELVSFTQVENEELISIHDVRQYIYTTGGADDPAF